MFLQKHIATLACCLPLLFTLGQLFLFGHSPNPIQQSLHATGQWSLIFLLLSLSITPLRKSYHLAFLIPPGHSFQCHLEWCKFRKSRQAAQLSFRRYRRLFGLSSFWYASCHVAIYIGLDQFFDFPAIYADIFTHKRILAGLMAYLTLLILAITSLSFIMRRMGRTMWRWLHKLVYLAAIGTLLHYLWLVKLDSSTPKLYGIVLALLFGWRLIISKNNSH